MVYAIRRIGPPAGIQGEFDSFRLFDVAEKKLRGLLKILAFQIGSAISISTD